jgi:uncharacterized protein (DUF169 family)
MISLSVYSLFAVKLFQQKSHKLRTSEHEEKQVWKQRFCQAKKKHTKQRRKFCSNEKNTCINNMS